MGLADVRRAVKTALEERGYEVGSDSHGLRNDLYVLGDGDLARALFAFYATAHEACDGMYQGSWVTGLPPRFVALPDSESASDAIELLEQISVVPVFYVEGCEGIEFTDLDGALDEHLPR